MRTRRIVRLTCLALLTVAGAVGQASAGAHTWDVNEIFTTADGRIWFIELWEANGTTGEVNVAGRPVSSTTKTFNIAKNVTAPTTHKHLLFANAAFAALPGVPVPDQIVAINNFFTIANDTIKYDPYDTWVVAAIPTDGDNSLNRPGGSGPGGVQPNSPRNYAGVTGHVTVGAGSGEVTLTMERFGAAQVRLNWTPSCEPSDGRYGIYQGNLTTLLPLGTYNHSGTFCNVSGLTRTLLPAFTNAYYLVVPAHGSNEGSYGTGALGARPQGSSPCATQFVTCTLP
jgi:hypothetical protein